VNIGTRYKRENSREFSLFFFLIAYTIPIFTIFTHERTSGKQIEKARVNIVKIVKIGLKIV